MPTPAPQPRLPLEPDRPLYQAPARFGCSGIALVCVATLLAFVFFLQVVAPALTARVKAIQLPRPFGGADVTASPTPGDSSLTSDSTPLTAPDLTPTLIALPPAETPTAPPAPPATPAPAAAEYVQVANTNGDGVWLRTDPRADANRLVVLKEKVLLVIAGPDQTVDGKVWRNVRIARDGAQTGWVLAQYLAPAAGP
ncbi:MAG TPA: hypothetical protein VKY74_01925 [Chloroflexia bacterium]|nr:hypothetical protein [Chloroflexia bacterium]